MRSELVILELTPPISMADLKSAYRKAAARHHPDHGGSHEGFIAVNDAYEQLKWEIERGGYQQPPQAPPPPSQPPYSPIVSKIWIEKIDTLIRWQRAMEYKKQWVVYQLLNSDVEPPLEVWQLLAARLGYQVGWAWYKSREWQTHPR